MGGIPGTPGVIWARGLAEVSAGLDTPVALIVRAEAMANFPPAPPGFTGDRGARRRVLAALAAQALGAHPAMVELVTGDDGVRWLQLLAPDQHQPAQAEPVEAGFRAGYGFDRLSLSGGIFASMASRGGWIVAVLAREPVGIDVETIAEAGAEAAGAAVLEGFDGELADWHGAAGVWAAKEAALKLAGRGIDTPARWQFGSGGRLTRDDQRLAIAFYPLPGAVAAVALSGNNTHAAPAASSAPAS